MSANPYDPVTTTDSTHLADDDWGLTLPPIRYKNYSGTSRFKSICNELRQHPKCVLVILAGIMVIVLLSIIIAVAASHSDRQRPTGNEPKWQAPEEGLVFYPVPEDKTIVISFTPKDFESTTDPLIKRWLNNVTEEYLMKNQIGQEFTDCNATYYPPDKVCRISRDLFGDVCTKYKQYGYHGAQPCVFIQLNLPNNVVIQPIKKGDPLWDAAKVALGGHSDPSHVPLTCDGTTEEDRNALGKLPGMGKENRRIEYFPSNGFSSYIYRERDTSLPFIKPAMMVQITDLPVGHKIHITCTAWGQLYDDKEKMIDHKLLSTEFALFVDHL